MRATHILEQLDPYVDDELPVTEAIAVGEHLTTCTSCSEAYQALLDLRRRIHETLPIMNAPELLRARVRDAVRAEAGTVAAIVPGRGTSVRRWSLAGPIAAVVVAVLLGGAALLAMVRGQRTGNALSDAVLTSHIRSLMADHLTDVASTDQHTVKPWFAGKLDFSPSVYSFDSAGFPLIGGRLDYVSGHPAAALVYHRRAHVINLFIWPTSDASASSVDEHGERGYSALHWRANGMEHWVTSDVNVADLRQLVALVRGADSTGATNR